MAQTTTIEWTDKTWNPTNGCEVISPGCANCYAMRFAGRFAKPGQRYHGLVKIAKNKRSVWTGEGRFEPTALVKPLTWRAPQRVFVNSMSDLFFDAFTNEEIAAVFGIMAACPQHRFQVLTKRPERMLKWFEWVAAEPTGLHTIPFSPRLICRMHADRIINPDMTGRPLGTESKPRSWPLPNVWLGVSVENQDAAVARIPLLLRTPAWLRFLSIEPLIGPVDLLPWLDPTGACDCPPGESHCIPECSKRASWRHTERDGDDPRIDWAIIGAESGPGARPCEVEWIRELVDRCKTYGVHRFLKQAYRMRASDRPDLQIGDTHPLEIGKGSSEGHRGLISLPYLDGVQYAEFPETQC